MDIIVTIQLRELGLELRHEFHVLLDFRVPGFVFRDACFERSDARFSFAECDAQLLIYGIRANAGASFAGSLAARRKLCFALLFKVGNSGL